MSQHPATRRQPPRALSRSIIACAIRQLSVVGIAAGALIAVAPTSAFAQAEASKAHRYNIPPGPLNSTLSRFGSEAGILLSFDPNTTAGIRSKGLVGTHTPVSALNALLAGTGLEAIQQRDGAYLLRKAAISPEGSATLAEVKVVAQAERSAQTEGSDSYVANGAKIGKEDTKSLREIPQSVSVVTHRQIEDQNLTTVSDALAQAPGVYLGTMANDMPVFQSRGYGMETSYDGISVSQGAGGGFDRSVLEDLSSLDHIEVLRGPAALLRGGNESPGFGGIVNLVRKKPKKEFSLSGELSAGSWNNYSGYVDVTGPLNTAGTLRGRAVLSKHDQNFFYKDARSEINSFYGVVEADLTPTTLLTLLADYQELDKHGKLSFIPRYGDTKQLITTDRSASFGEPWSGINRKALNTGATLQHTFVNDWKFKANFNYQSEDYDNIALTTSGYVKSDNTANFSAIGFIKKVHSRGYDISVGGPFEFLGRKHEATLGIDGSSFSDHGDSPYASFSNRNVFNPNISNPFSSLIPDYNAYIWDFTQRSAYASTRWQLSDSLKLVLGARSLLKMKTQVTGYASSNNRDISGKTTPYTGIIWDLSPNVSAYASYGQQFIPQTKISYMGELLPPQIGWQSEIGVKGEFFDKRLTGSVAFYRVRDKNRAILDDDHTGCNNSNGYCYVAAGLVQSQGLDTEISGSPIQGLMLTAGYTYNQNKYLDDATTSNIGQRFNGATPRHLFKLWGVYEFQHRDFEGVLNGWKVGAGVIAQSEIFVNSSIRQGGYSVVSALIGYNFSPKTSVTVNINNVFDRHYLQTLSSNYGNYFGAPRSVQMTFRHQF
ncbi:MAG: TonB-dependent siderophore receptor [Acidovorax sp.]